MPNFPLRRLFLLLVSGALLAALARCVSTEPIFPLAPQIEFVEFSTDTVVSGREMTITISFQDGDGDLGSNNGSGEPDLFVQDLRPFFPDTQINPISGDTVVLTGKLDYPLPYWEQQAANPSILGEIDIPLQEGFVALTQGFSQGETTQYEIFLVDRAGNRSNVLITPPLVILPDTAVQDTSLPDTTLKRSGWPPFPRMRVQ